MVIVLLSVKLITGRCLRQELRIDPCKRYN
jgi:hypothetical protein